MARPPHIPEPGERRQVEAMAAYGIPEADIARVIGIDPKTQRKHYRDELDTGHVKANARVAEVLFIVAELGIDIDPIMLHLYAVLAERERRLISSARGRPWPSARRLEHSSATAPTRRLRPRSGDGLR